jgi:glucokinase
MYIGIDIGGTKCAVISANDCGKKLSRVSFPTTDYESTMKRIMQEVAALMPCRAIGISCGGPLDEKRGMILSPPNLPGWDEVPIVTMLEERFQVPAYLCNDANACALAEWRFGAGIGTQNMVFLTFGTGMGAGLILDGKLYRGTNGNADEVGHMRLADYGPVGYGKIGSFEGFCSGGGIKQLGQTVAREAIQQGASPSFCPTMEDIEHISAKSLAEAADSGDEVACRIWQSVAEKLGLGLSLLIDLLNPEAIVIGSIFERSEHLLRTKAEEIIHREALSQSREVCRILPAALGDEIGDYAAIAVAMKEVLPNETC